MNILNMFKKKRVQVSETKPTPTALDNYLDDVKTQEEAERYSREAVLSDADKDAILKDYFKNAPKLVSLTGQPKKYAFDSVNANEYGFCKDGLVTQYGRKDDRIFTYYAQHGFLGWQICAILAQHWLINLAISVPVDDAVRPGWKNTIENSDESEDQDASLKLYDITNKKYHLATKATQWLKKSRIFGVGYALICIDGINYEEPYNKDGIKPGSFKGISVIEPYWITPQWMNSTLNDPGSPDFYEPDYYYVQGIGKVHKSHIIKTVHDEVSDILKPSYYFGGVSLSQQIYERVYAAERVANEAPLLALTKRLLVVPTNLRALAEKPDLMMKMVDRLVHGRDNQGIYFTEEGEKSAVHQVDTTLTDFDQLILTQYQLVACIAKMPAHKLLKTDPKGLNNNGGYTLKDYAQELMGIQENKLRNLVERVNEIALLSDMPEVEKGARVTVTFEPVDAPTELEKAQTEKVKVDSNVALVQAGVLAPEEVRDIMRNDKDSTYSGIADEMPVPEVSGDLELLDDMTPNGGERGKDVKPIQDALVMDDRWITVHPPHGNKEGKGVPLKIDEGGTITAGAGGKFTGKKINEIKKKTATNASTGITKAGGNNTQQGGQENTQLKNNRQGSLAQEPAQPVQQPQQPKIDLNQYTDIDDLLRTLPTKEQRRELIDKVSSDARVQALVDKAVAFRNEMSRKAKGKTLNQYMADGMSKEEYNTWKKLVQDLSDAELTIAKEILRSEMPVRKNFEDLDLQGPVDGDKEE